MMTAFPSLPPFLPPQASAFSSPAGLCSGPCALPELAHAIDFSSQKKSMPLSALTNTHAVCLG